MTFGNIKEATEPASLYRARSLRNCSSHPNRSLDLLPAIYEAVPIQAATKELLTPNNRVDSCY